MNITQDRSGVSLEIVVCLVHIQVLGATGSGGGLASYQMATVLVTGSTFTANDAYTEGGAMWALADSDGVITVSNSRHDCCRPQSLCSGSSADRYVLHFEGSELFASMR